MHINFTSPQYKNCRIAIILQFLVDFFQLLFQCFWTRYWDLILVFLNLNLNFWILFQCFWDLNFLECQKLCLISYQQANKLWKAHVLPPKMLWKPIDLMTLQWSGLVRWWTYENQCLWTLQTKCFKSDQIIFLWMDKDCNGGVLCPDGLVRAGVHKCLKDWGSNLHVSFPVLCTDLIYVG